MVEPETASNRSDLLARALLLVRNQDLAERRLVNVFGPAGSGKSTLVEEMIHALRSQGYRVARLPTLGLEPRALDLDMAMSRALVQVEGMVGPLVFVADPFDELAALGSWIARRTRDPDRGAVGLVLVTRRPMPEPFWAEVRLTYVAASIEVPPLSRDEAIALCTSLGVAEQQAESLYATLGGHPLSLSLVSQEVLGRRGSASFPALTEASQALAQVTRLLVQRVPSLAHQKGLLAASMLPALTDALLEAVLTGHDEAAREAVSDWLWQLPFVASLPFGLAVHDSIRPLILEDALRNRPRLLGTCCRLIHDFLDRQLVEALRQDARSADRARRNELAEQLAYLVLHHPLVRPKIGLNPGEPARFDAADYAHIGMARDCVRDREGEEALVWFDRWLRVPGTVMQGIFDAQSTLRGFLLFLTSEVLAHGANGDPVVQRTLELAARTHTASRATLARFWFSLEGYQSPLDPWVPPCHVAITRLNVALRPRFAATCHLVDPAYTELIEQLIRTRANGDDEVIEGAGRHPCALAHRASPHGDDRPWLWTFLWASAGSAEDEPFRAQSKPPAPSGPTTPLSDRELDVLRLLAEGYRYEQVADRLGISLGSARTYVRRAYLKLGVATKSEATLLAVRLGLLK